MRLTPTLAWLLTDQDRIETLDARLLPLLDAVAKGNSLAAAVIECGISYRAAWGLLRGYQQKIGVPLVILHRGRGATLSPAGERLVQAQRTATRRLESILPTLGVDLDGAMPGAKKRAVMRLRISASHDLALASLSAVPDVTDTLEFKPSFMGSLLALKDFAQGNADIAGFHLPIGGPKAGVTWDKAPFLDWLKPRTDRLLRFIDREQGLILPRGNPARVKNFRDLARTGLRFVNRQQGSGTRILIDRIIAGAGIEPARLSGYASEEFTHGAVAATVASGGADAGFGLRAAAAEYQLDFVRLVRERYYFAVRAKDLDRPQVAKLIELLRTPAFATHVRRFAGCDPAGAGSVVSLAALGND